MVPTIRVALAATLLCWTFAQPDEPCPPTTPCRNDPLSCNLRNPVYSWPNLEVLTNCQLPLEIRVGLTVSMTGTFHRTTETTDLLSTLRNMSMTHGTVNVVNYGVTLLYCFTFCVVDDESRISKAVDTYRVFADTTEPQSSMDLLLGPSTWDFRMAAAQVAEEYQMPLVLWSFPESLGMGQVLPTNTQVKSTIHWLISLFQAPKQLVLTDTILGRLPPQLQFNCSQLSLPEDYTLRTLAQFLPCDGPCNVTRDLDYCAQKPHELSLSGVWFPETVLRNGGWHEDCVNINVTGGTAGFVSVILYFATSSAPVEVLFEGANDDTGPFLFLDGRVYATSPGRLRLKSGSSLRIEFGSPAQITVSLCIRENCSSFDCPADYIRSSDSAVCKSVSCTEEDLHTCCTTEINAAAANGPFWNQAFTTHLDLAVLPSRMMEQTLPMLLHPRAQFVLCVAQADEEEIYSKLCRSHIERSQKVGFRSLEQPISVISADRGVHHTIIHLMLKQPPPSLVIVCSDMETYSRFIHGLEANAITFQWVTSCIPFGDQLQMKVRGSLLAYNFVEPTPWPSLIELQQQDEVLLEDNLPTQSFASLIKEQPNLSLQMLALRSSVQILHQVAQTSVNSFGQGLADGEETDGIVYLVQALTKSFSFNTYLGTLQFDAYGRRQITRREVGMRQFVPLEDLSELSDSQVVSVEQTWGYNQARHAFSRFREFQDSEAPLAPNYPAFLANKMRWTYPCPPGCVASSLKCHSCPPGTFRQASGLACSSCLQSKFQDQWAGDRCFNCPKGGICNSTRGPPIAKPGFVRVANVRYLETFEDYIGPNACSTESGGGLSQLRSTDLTRWHEAKEQSPWILQRCVPPEACIGENQCAQFHTGSTCSSCREGGTKFEWWFFKLSCHECPPMGLLILQISVMVVIQVLCTLMLSTASRDSAWNEHSLAGPLIFLFLRALQTHAVLSKMLMERFVHARKKRTSLVALPVVLPEETVGPEGCGNERSFENTGVQSHHSPRRRIALPFNSIDFKSRTQPAPSRYPELDWFDEPVNTTASKTGTD